MLKNLSIRTRVVVAFAVMLLLTLGLGLFSVTRLEGVSADSKLVSDNALPSIKALAKINVEVLRTRSTQFQHIISVEDKDMNDTETRLRDRAADLRKAEEMYEPLISSKEERDQYNKFRSEWEKYMLIWERLLPVSRANDIAKASIIVRDELSPAYREMQSTLDTLVAINEKSAAEAAGEIERGVTSSEFATFSLLIAAIIIGIAAGWSLIVSVVRPVRGMTDTMNLLAKHELTVAVDGGERGDEIGDMARAVQVFKDGLIEADRLAEAQKQEQAAKEARATRI
ncbi:MCP four helix bundle domain-containing protein, partial [Niveispirillum sp.]|uniref:MCP four helix bundle domain-containing protein n=1 Tax=Niveispirillum sp. TaxID=1917217 RepID=UPI001B751163